MKKTRSKKSRDTVHVTMIKKFTVKKFYVADTLIDNKLRLSED